MQQGLLVIATERSTLEGLSANASSDLFRIIPKGRPPDHPPVEPPGEEGAPVWLWAVIVVVVLAAVAMAIVLASARGREVPTASGAMATLPSTCPVCGSSMDTDNASGRPYCKKCDRYY